MGNSGYILYDNISDKEFNVVCELELQDMKSESGSNSEKFVLHKHDKTLLKLHKDGPGPFSYSFNSKVSFAQSKSTDKTLDDESLKKKLIDNIQPQKLRENVSI